MLTAFIRVRTCAPFNWRIKFITYFLSGSKTYSYLESFLKDSILSSNPSRRIHTKESFSKDSGVICQSMPKNKFACHHPGCIERFDNKSSLRRHKQVHFKTLRYECDDCPGKKFKFLQSLQKHRRLRHSKEPRPIYVCDICQRTTVDFTGMRYHLKGQHDFNDKDARFEARGMICRPINLLGMIKKGVVNLFISFCR